MKFIESHNARFESGHETYKVKENQYSDMTN
jgi:hypothetical protein